MKPFEQQVRERAYYIWEGEGRVFGRADDHWLRAETELRSDRVSSPELIPAVAADISLAASPAKTLKPKARRTKSAAAEAVAQTPVAASAKSARAAKSNMEKSSTAKARVAKAAPAKSRTPRATAASSLAIH